MLPPAQRLDALLAGATRHVTREEGCPLVWHEWPSTQGRAPTLLLLHGGFGSWSHWVANIEPLSEHFRVWTVDLPGLGESGLPSLPHTVPRFADLVARGWTQLRRETDRFDIAGFSFGAMVAGRLAAMAGDQCARCLLIGAVGFGDLQVQVELLPPPGPDADSAEADATHRENLARLMVHDSACIDPLAVHIHAENLSRFRFNSRGVAVTNALAKTLPEISARLVGIWGEEDATAGGAANIEARRALFLRAQAQSAFHMLPGVGHWAMYEAPRQINQLILEA